MKKCFLFIIIMFSVFSCDDDLTSSQENRVFDRVGFLKNVLTNHTLPEFSAFRTDVADLVEAKNTFILDKTAPNLEALRIEYLKAYTSYQSVAKHNLGVTLDINFTQNLNTFPFNLNDVEAFVLGNINLQSVTTQNRQGLPAVDYLLNGLAVSDEEIVAFYTGSNGDAYTEYLSNVIDRIDSLSAEASNDWNGSFGSEFSNDGEFFNAYVNAYIEYVEGTIRRNKIDFPSGKLSGVPMPEAIESLFKPEESRELLEAALDSARLLYLGIDEQQISLSRLLNDLEEDGLDAKIKLAFLEAQNQVARLDNNLKLQVETDNGELLRTRDALQEVVRLLKIDLASTLDVSIFIADNDGD